MPPTWSLPDRRTFCDGTATGLTHSPESLPDMNRAGRYKQICLHCKEPLTVTLIDGIYRWVVHEYMITEEPELVDP